MTRNMIKAAISFLVVPVALAFTPYGRAQQQPPTFQQKLQSLQETMAISQQQLHTYQWMETTTLTINGSMKQPKEALCQYGPDGNLVKSSIGSGPSPQVSGGLLKQHIIRKKIEEFQTEMADVGSLTALYLPLDKVKFEQALHTRRVDLERDGSSGTSVVVNDYAKPGDQLRITFNPQTLQIQEIKVNSYFAGPQDSLAVQVHFSELADKTVYPGLTTINASSKKILITTTESDFSKPAR